MQQQILFLTRDVDAVLIPAATAVHLPQHTQVVLFQALGGNFTVQVNGNLARIAGVDADALGFDAPPVDARKSTHTTATGPCDQEAVWKMLSTCYDPEIPVNIVDLGLIYACDFVQAKASLGSLVSIKMTLTAPGCNMGPVLIEDISNKLYQIENVVDVQIELVFDPPWDQDRMTNAAKLQLNLF